MGDKTLILPDNTLKLEYDSADETSEWPLRRGDGSVSTHDHPDMFHEDEDGEFASLAVKAAPVAADVLVIEDSAASYAKKKTLAEYLPKAFGGADGTFSVVTAVQDNAGTIEYKTRSLTFTDGILTTLGAESGWTST